MSTQQQAAQEYQRLQAERAEQQQWQAQFNPRIDEDAEQAAALAEWRRQHPNDGRADWRWVVVGVLGAGGIAVGFWLLNTVTR